MCIFLIYDLISFFTSRVFIRRNLVLGVNRIRDPSSILEFLSWDRRWDITDIYPLVAFTFCKDDKWYPIAWWGSPLIWNTKMLVYSSTIDSSIVIIPIKHILNHFPQVLYWRSFIWTLWIRLLLLDDLDWLADSTSLYVGVMLCPIWWKCSNKVMMLRSWGFRNTGLLWDNIFPGVYWACSFI
jgi:hypothetical protein